MTFYCKLCAACVSSVRTVTPAGKRIDAGSLALKRIAGRIPLSLNYTTTCQRRSRHLLPPEPKTSTQPTSRSLSASTGFERLNHNRPVRTRRLHFTFIPVKSIHRTNPAHTRDGSSGIPKSIIPPPELEPIDHITTWTESNSG